MQQPLVITLVNPCKNDPFHGKKNARPATNKPDKANHGYELKSIQKMAETHRGNLKMYYTSETQSFIQ